MSTKWIAPLCVALLSVAAVGCDTPTHAPNAVHAAFLRAEYAKTLIAEMDEYQFAGDASNALSGGAELFDRVGAMAADVFPDGEYVAHIGVNPREIEGFESHCAMSWGGWKRQVYRRSKSDR